MNAKQYRETIRKLRRKSRLCDFCLGKTAQDKTKCPKHLKQAAAYMRAYKAKHSKKRSK